VVATGFSHADNSGHSRRVDLRPDLEDTDTAAHITTMNTNRSDLPGPRALRTAGYATHTHTPPAEAALNAAHEHLAAAEHALAETHEALDAIPRGVRGWQRPTFEALLDAGQQRALQSGELHDRHGHHLSRLRKERRA